MKTFISILILIGTFLSGTAYANDTISGLAAANVISEYMDHGEAMEGVDSQGNVCVIGFVLIKEGNDVVGVKLGIRGEKHFSVKAMAQIYFTDSLEVLSHDEIADYKLNATPRYGKEFIIHGNSSTEEAGYRFTIVDPFDDKISCFHSVAE